MNHYICGDYKGGHTGVTLAVSRRFIVVTWTLTVPLRSISEIETVHAAKVVTSCDLELLGSDLRDESFPRAISESVPNDSRRPRVLMTARCAISRRHRTGSRSVATGHSA